MESNEDVSIPQPGMAIKADDDDLHITSRDPCKTDKIVSPEETKAHHGPVLQEHFLNKDKNNKVSGGHEVPRFLLDGRSIIIFSDVCQAVLKTWGSYNNLQNMLKNLGIEKCQFDQSQVMLMLKNIGVVDLQTKRCSFITEEDFIQIVHKYDEEYSTNYAKYFQLSPAIAIDDHSLAMKFQRNQGEEEHHQVSVPGTTGLTQSTMPLQCNIHVFSMGNQDCVNLSELYGLFETHFQRPDFLNRVLQNLKIAVGTCTAYEQARVKIQSSISCDDNLRKLYITKKDFERVLQYTSALFDTNLLDISWVQLGNMGVTVDRAGVNRYGNVLSNPSSTYVMAKIPENSIATDKDASQENILLGSESNHAMPHPCTQSTVPESENSSATETAGTSNSGMGCVIRTCLVYGEVVVCIPDLHKAVIDLYGQSVQVGNYMHRLNIPTHRFSRNFLKRLKAHNILSSKATICTYITKVDAERLLKMYHRGIHSDNRTDSLPRIEWAEPIILENAVNNASHYHLGQIDSLFIQKNDEVKVKIPLFIINHQVVVAMPDVHRAVQLLNGHSVQLRYDLDKLGITKHKYSYSEVHQLRVQGHLDRPSLCTYVTKADVDRLLQYYTTPENEDSLKFIEWQQPVAVESIQNASVCDSMGSSEIESIGAEDENNTDGQIANDYSISDLYKAFVGDDLESGWSSSNEIDDNHSQKTLQQISPLSSPTLPTVTFSPVLQRTLDKRDELISGSDLLQANTTASSRIKSTSQQPSDRFAVNQAVMKVSQMQVDLCSRSECIPAVSKALCISPQTFCERHNPIVTTAVSNQTSSQVLPPSPSSSCTTVPDFNICRTDTSSTNVHVSPLATEATVCSVSAATTGRVGQFLSYGSTSCEICLHSPKRSNVSSLSGPTWLEKQAKKLKADDEDILKTLQRKETEMRILHDAYQEQIKQEREHRLALQRELDQLKDSNTDLLKNIERKELEMKILHDSYKLQMDLERKKREELEMEVLQLRGKLGASANVPRVKQELL